MSIKTGVRSIEEKNVPQKELFKRMKTRPVLRLFFANVSILFAFSVQAAVITVTSNADTGAGSLPVSIASALKGDTVVFQLPAGSETVVVGKQITIAKAVTVDGSNAAGSGNRVTIKVPVSYAEARASASLVPSTFRVFLITGGRVVLRNLSIRGGRVGPDLLSYGENQYKAGGGAIAITGRDSTNVTMTGVSVSGSCARDSVENRLGVSGVRSCGGGIYNEGRLIMDSCAVFLNALYSFAYANAGVTRSTSEGAGICNAWVLELRRSSVSENRARAFAEYDANPCATARGGGIYNQGILTVVASTISSDTAESESMFYQNGTGYSYGGGIYSDGILAVCMSTLYGNAAMSRAYPGTSHTTFPADLTTSYGGGMYLGDTAKTEIVSSTIVDNRVSAASSLRAYYYGRSIYSRGTTCLLNCIVTGPAVYQLMDVCYDGGIVRAYHNYVGYATRADTFALKGGFWDASNRIYRVTTDLLGDQTPLLRDNGGPSKTIALPLNSNAAGNGVRTGSYGEGAAVHYDAFWSGTAWTSASTGASVSGVKELTVDQRGTPIEIPPSVGAYYLKGSSVLLPSRPLSGRDFSMRINKNASLVIIDRSSKYSAVRLMAPDGRTLQHFAITKNVTVDVSMLSSGIYFIRLEGPGACATVEKFIKN
jgi:hypothetical protein